MGQLRTANKRHNRMMTKTVAVAKPVALAAAKADDGKVAA